MNIALKAFGPKKSDLSVTFPSEEEWFKRFQNIKVKFTRKNASYAGVRFCIDTSEGTFGRRIVVHEFPGRNDTEIEDMGGKSRGFVVTGFLIGGDYLTQRDKLLNVCEAKGEAELIHPYYGTLKVKNGEIKFSDNRKDTRICGFQVNFYESGEKVFKSVSANTPANVAAQTKKSILNKKRAFDRLYRSVQAQVALIAGVKEVINSAVDAIVEAKKFANMPSEFLRAVDSIQAKIDLFFLEGEDLFDALAGLITFGIIPQADTIEMIPEAATLELLAEDETEIAAEINGVSTETLTNEEIEILIEEEKLETEQAAFEGLTDLMDFTDDLEVKSDDSTEVAALVQQVAVMGLCSISSTMTYTSAKQAEETRNKIFTKIDDILEANPADPYVTVEPSDQVAQDFRDLRKTVNEDITSRSLQLPEISEFTPVITTPALVVSNTFYGDASKEADIIARNEIEHPGFIPGGEPIEVLLDA